MQKIRKREKWKGIIQKPWGGLGKCKPLSRLLKNVQFIFYA